MNVTMRKDAPPYVRFEYQEYGVNAEASKTSGRQIPNVVPFALIMQHGSKDVTEKVAEEWLDQIDVQARDGRYNPDWVSMFRRQFEGFLRGNELPRDGTPIRTWAAINREQVMRLLALEITTVEDLAAQPDSGLGRIGLDGRNLRDLAAHYIADGKGAAGNAKKIADLEETNRQQADTIKRMQESIQALEAALPRNTLHAPKKAA